MTPQTKVVCLMNFPHTVMSEVLRNKFIQASMRTFHFLRLGERKIMQNPVCISWPSVLHEFTKQE
jgi:hypothetical protein